MPFTLRIHLTGLCLFVPEPSPPDLDRGPRLHTLLLKHGHHGHEHYPRLIYDRGYENRPPVVMSHLRCRKLDGRLLNFDSLGDLIDAKEGFGHPKLPGKLPEQIVDLNEITDVGPLDRRFVGLNPNQDIVAARVTIFNGRFENHLDGACWTVQAPSKPSMWPRQITTLVCWEIPDIQKESVTLLLRNLKSGKEEDRITLYPIEDRIDLWVYNATEDDLPPAKRKPVSAGTPAEHFEAYYKPFKSTPQDHPILKGEPSGNAPAPIPSDCKPGKQTSGGTLGVRLKPRTAHTPTCLTAQAEVQ